VRGRLEKKVLLYLLGHLAIHAIASRSTGWLPKRRERGAASKAAWLLLCGECGECGVSRACAVSDWAGRRASAAGADGMRSESASSAVSRRREESGVQVARRNLHCWAAGQRRSTSKHAGAAANPRRNASHRGFLSVNGT
jgi:hypothetical protein